MYYTNLPFPICLGMCGALAGLAGGGCNQCFPIWVGAATGSSVGCVICMCAMAFTEEPVPLSTKGATEPVIIHNTYITHVYGQSKDIPIAKIVE